MKHEFMTRRETHPELYADEPADDYVDGIDLFAYSIGSCNGPKCKRCGKSVCEHHNPEFLEEDCLRKVSHTGELKSVRGIC